MVGYVGTVERQDTRRDGPHLPLSILRSRPGIRRARAIGLIRLERREKLLENCLGHEKAIIKYFTKISTPNNLPQRYVSWYIFQLNMYFNIKLNLWYIYASSFVHYIFSSIRNQSKAKEKRILKNYLIWKGLETVQAVRIMKLWPHLADIFMLVWRFSHWILHVAMQAAFVVQLSTLLIIAVRNKIKRFILARWLALLLSHIFFILFKN